MEDSKSNKALPALAIWSNSNPNAFACVTALAIASGLDPNWALICPVTLLDASKTPFKLIWAPVWEFTAFTASSWVFKDSSKVIPSLAASPANWDVASADITCASNIDVAPTNILLFKTAAVWKDALIDWLAFNIPSVVTLKSSEFAAARAIPPANSRASVLLIPRSFWMAAMLLLALIIAFTSIAKPTSVSLVTVRTSSKLPFNNSDNVPDSSNLSAYFVRLPLVRSRRDLDFCPSLFLFSSDLRLAISSLYCSVNDALNFNFCSVVSPSACVIFWLVNKALVLTFSILASISFWTFVPLFILDWRVILSSNPPDIFLIEPTMSLSYDLAILAPTLSIPLRLSIISSNIFDKLAAIDL